MKNFVRFICLVMVLSLCIASIASAEAWSKRYSDNTLKRSSTVKTVVKNVQADFTKNTSYSLTHDGIYGSNTFKAAKEFQKKKGLDIDGQTGKNTKKKLWNVMDDNYHYGY